MTPGPTPVSASGLLAQAQPAIYHRGHRFAQMLDEVIKGLQWLLQTDNDVLVLTGSGTGALEAAIVNCFSPGERVLVAVNGLFGDRVRRIATAFALERFFGCVLGRGERSRRSSTQVSWNRVTNWPDYLEDLR